MDCLICSKKLWKYQLSLSKQVKQKFSSDVLGVTKIVFFLRFAALLTHNLKLFSFFQTISFLHVFNPFSYSVMESLYLIGNIQYSRSMITKDKQTRYSPCHQGGYISKRNNKMGNFNPKSCLLSIIPG